jgi:DNA polymerase-3 subunit alpha
MPDIDCDFEDRRRTEIIDYLQDRWGEKHVARISTVGRMTGKQCLRDVARVLDVPAHEVGEISSSIIVRNLGDGRAVQTIEDSFRLFQVCRDFNTRYPDVLGHAMKLEGQARGLGIHAAGIVVSPTELTDLIPLETRNHHGERLVCSGIDMWGTEAIGLMKIDVLGLRTLSIISDCLNAIEERHGVRIDLDVIDTNDPDTLNGFTQQDYTGIFQFDTPGMEKVCEGIEFTRFEDCTIAVALDRPGTTRSGLSKEFIKRKKDPKNIESIHPVVDKICADTLGIVIYQEHAIRIFTEIAGYTAGEADHLRKHIAKSSGAETLGRQRKRFIEGSVARGFPRKLAQKLIDQITHFGSYSFNKSHATAYALISYRQMWLKVHYPHEFFWAALVHEPTRGKIMRLITAAKRAGIDIREPDVNVSKETFTLTGDEIVSGLADLKGVGPAAVESIVENQPYVSFLDFHQKIDRRRVHKGVIMALVKAGALSTLIPNTKWFVENLETIWKRRGRKDWDLWIENQLKDSRSHPDYDEEKALLIAGEVSPLAFGKHPIEPYTAFLDSAKVDWVGMDEKSVWENDWAWVRGIISEVKLNQIGDFHVGPLPDDDEMKRRNWGARYAKINVEDIEGNQQRIKINTDIYDSCRSVIDKGNGTPVVVLMSAMRRWKKLQANILLDASELRRKDEQGEEYDNMEMACMDIHKLMRPYKKKDLIRRLNKLVLDKKPQEVNGIALVTNVGKKIDKNMNQMAFVGLHSLGGFRSTVCFASSWPSLKYLIKPGAILEIWIDASRSGLFITDAERLEE